MQGAHFNMINQSEFACITSVPGRSSWPSFACFNPGGEKITCHVPKGCGCPDIRRQYMYDLPTFPHEARVYNCIILCMSKQQNWEIR